MIQINGASVCRGHVGGMAEIALRGLKLFQVNKRKRLTLAIVAEEPFRLFFPLGFLAGVIGVTLWPLHFGGIFGDYPGISHARIMAHGFFGGFILGFLGTALPRLMELRSLNPTELIALAAAFVTMVAAHVGGNTLVGDVAFLCVLAIFAIVIGRRLGRGSDLPPPGFVLVGLAWLCASAGPVIAIVESRVELTSEWFLAGRLLTYQGFVLFPVMGVSGFLLRKFLGTGGCGQCAGGSDARSAWVKHAIKTGVVGMIILATFALEVFGWNHTAYFIRFAVAGLYIFCASQVHKTGFGGTHLEKLLKCALGMILLGLLLVAMFPGYRVALLHVALVGGFALFTMCVATRVVLGHSGNGKLLKGKTWWLVIATVFMLMGMATRISGDYFPKILVSHYNYGALFWVIGAGVWGWKVLPKVWVPDPED